MGAELFHVDGQTETDKTKLIAAFGNLENAPKNKSVQQSKALRFYRFLTLTAAVNSVNLKTYKILPKITGTLHEHHVQFW